MIRAMSKVWARRFIAGTVKPFTSPRLRAMYRSWIDADMTPRAWPASQTSQRAASAVASSVVKAAVQARSAAASERKRAASSMTSVSPATCAIPERCASRSAGELATYGIEA